MIDIQGARARWQLPKISRTQAAPFALKYNLSVPVAQAIMMRGYTDERSIERFLTTARVDEVADSRLLKDAERAADRIIVAIERGEKILIAGDYDVDGVTSSALMLLCLRPLGAQINFFLPHRVRDGYGLSVKTMQRAAENEYRVVITVDNGITAFEPAEVARQHGIDLIVTDHHRPHDHVPDAYAIVDPHQESCTYPFKYFAGVGVSFKIISLIYEKLGKTLPDKAYELLLLGTVADVVPLVGENRFWVRHGLTCVNRTESTSLRILKKNARFAKSTLSSLDIGFFLTPQINALGRLDDPRDAVKFLIGDDPQETERIGDILVQCNEARKGVEKQIIADVERRIEQGIIDPAKELVIVAASSDWPPGVIGLAASRIMNTYARPTVLLHTSADGSAKGSCRSIVEVNIFNALTHSRHLLRAFGGHAHAAGLSLDADKIPELKRALEQYILATTKPEDFIKKLYLDAELTLSEASTKCMSDLTYMEPFGCENPAPTFYIPQVSLINEPQLLKEQHVKCMVFAEGVIKPVIFFNRPELFEKFRAHGSAPFDLAAHVVSNEWNGRTTVELQGIDVFLGADA